MRKIDIHTPRGVSRNCHTIRVPTSRRTWCYAGNTWVTFFHLSLSRLSLSLSLPRYNTSWQCRIALTCEHGGREAASERASERARDEALYRKPIRALWPWAASERNIYLAVSGACSSFQPSVPSFTRWLARRAFSDSELPIDIYLFTSESADTLVRLKSTCAYSYILRIFKQNQVFSSLISHLANYQTAKQLFYNSWKKKPKKFVLYKWKVYHAI